MCFRPLELETKYQRQKKEKYLYEVAAIEEKDFKVGEKYKLIFTDHCYCTHTTCKYTCGEVYEVVLNKIETRAEKGDWKENYIYFSSIKNNNLSNLCCLLNFQYTSHWILRYIL